MSKWLQERHLKYKEIERLQIKGYKELCYASTKNMIIFIAKRTTRDTSSCNKERFKSSQRRNSNFLSFNNIAQNT